MSGPAAGLTVIVLGLVQQYGHEVLGPIVLLAGGLQVLAGALHLGPWFRAVSPAVIRGMLSGIGVLIFASQFHVMVDDAPKKDGLTNLFSIPDALRKGLPIPEWQPDDDRQARVSVLKTAARMHETQEEISDEVHTHVSDHSTAAEAAAQAGTLKPLLERQTKLVDDLRNLVEKIEGRHPGEEIPLSESQRAAAVDALKAAEIAKGDLAANVKAGMIAKTTDDSGRIWADVRVSQTKAVGAIEGVLGQLRSHDWAAKVGLAAIAIILLWKLAPKPLQMVPSPLVAVVAMTVLCSVLVLPVKTVELPARLTDGIHLVSANIFKDVPFAFIIQGAVLIAVVASAETLLCASAVDQMHQGPRTKYDRELAAQGVGNMLCGILGGLPMTGVIVRSAANVQAGGKTRLSAILHGIWLLVFVAFLSSVLQMIPTSCLAGLLVYTGIKLMDFRAIPELARFGISEVGIYVATVATIVGADLLTGVIVGIVLSALKLLYTFSHLSTQLDLSEDRSSATLSLEGAATFLRLPNLAAMLEQVPRGAELRVDLERLSYIDHACLDLLVTWARQHEATGGSLVVNWDELKATFRNGMQPARNNGGTISGNGSHTANGHPDAARQAARAGAE